MLRALSLGACASLFLFASCATLLGLDEERELGSVDGGSAAGGSGGAPVAAGGAGGAGDPYVDLVLSDGPVAYFRFEDKTAEVAFANSIDSNLAAQKEGEVHQGPGKVGKAGSFSGQANAHAGDVYDFPEMAEMSVELWLNTPAPRGGLQQLVSKRLGDAEGYAVTIDSQRRVTFTRTRGTMSTNVRHLLDADQDYGRFIHVVATFSTDLGSRLFIDAEQRGEAPTADEVSLLDNDGELEIGGDAGVEFTGFIDEVALYSRELTLDEIEEHFAMASP